MRLRPRSREPGYRYRGESSGMEAPTVRKRTKSEVIQFRLLLEDYAVLERLADDAGVTPKDYVITLTLERVAEERAVAS